ncbi:MAG: SLC13 family permease [Candidatus Micrarchaeia archaeon]
MVSIIAIPIVILIIVLFLITLRQLLNLNIEIWQIMLLGAISVIALNEISFSSAIESIDMDVMLFLFSIFIIGKALEESGYLSHLSYSFLKNSRNAEDLLFFLILLAGFGSAILMNDTLAIIGTPLVLHLAEKHNLPKKMMLLALAFSITIGSVMSPIGNPQNLLIATKANLPNPFITFLYYLFIPTLLNLFILFFLLKYFYGSNIKYKRIDHYKEPIRDSSLAVLSFLSLVLLFILIIIYTLSFIFHFQFLSLSQISFISAAILMVFSNKRFEIIKGIDWGTLVFFASMFILMQAVWDTGTIQEELQYVSLDLSFIPVIIFTGIVVSQLISNVPFVALYLPILLSNSFSESSLMALAAGSTIAGNFMILGAASNVIIIQNAEKRGATLTAKDFLKVGVPLTLFNALIYSIYLMIV